MTKNDDDSRLPPFAILQNTVNQLFFNFPNKVFTNNEIEQFVIQELSISETAQKIPREKSRTELQYRLAWVRTKAKSSGLIARVGVKSWRSVS